MSGCDKAICLFSLLFLIQIWVRKISQRKIEEASASVHCSQRGELSDVIYPASGLACGPATADQPRAQGLTAERHVGLKERLIQPRACRATSVCGDGSFFKVKFCVVNAQSSRRLLEEENDSFAAHVIVSERNIHGH